MKTAIKTLIASTLTALVLTTTAAATFAQAPAVTTVSAPANFNKLVVTGNAKVILVQRHKEGINVSDVIEADKITVKQKGYTLYINSTEKEPSTIYLYVKDLQRIDASNTASVRTLGAFDLNVLQIFLQNDAKASVKAKVGSLYTNMKDASSLKLSGSSDEHVLVKTEVVNLKMSEFACVNTNISTVTATAALSK